jgi:hypothetical protein
MSSLSTSTKTEELVPGNSAERGTQARGLIEMSSQMARLGYGEQVVEYALRRKGIRTTVARLVAASVVSCHRTICAAEAHAKRAPSRPSPRSTATAAEIRAARAARLALGKMMGFLAYIVIGIGGGVLVGWSFGFDRGVEDGYGWMLRALELMAAR